MSALNHQSIMKTNIPIVISLALLALSTLNLQLSTAFAQGSLTPPGAPAPTMLTLNQIEPRTPISSAPYTISSPGSYYLTTNIIGVSSQNGINIYANNVTLDLNGFSLQGVSSAINGISIQSSYTNVTVRNGTISAWGAGWHGIECYGNNVILEHLILTANSYSGLYWQGNNGVIRDCMVSGSPYGIFMGGSGLLVVGNNLAGNTVGIYIVNGANQIEGNHVTGNGGYGLKFPAFLRELQTTSSSEIQSEAAARTIIPSVLLKSSARSFPTLCLESSPIQIRGRIFRFNLQPDIL